MGFFTLFLTSLGLSMDACAVSISNGMCYTNIKNKQILSTAFSFGFFQTFMPVLGYIVGLSFREYITFLDHWIALILLGAIGGKMMIDGIKDIKNPEACITSNKILKINILVMQSIATSIDAFAVGIGFAVMKVNIYSACTTIGIVTFLNSIIGSLLGKKFGGIFKQKAEILGGLILILIGLKIFIEHMILGI